MVNYDAEYFSKRGLEQRHFYDANTWLDYWGHNATFCCLGDSHGQHTFALDYYGAKVIGGDLEWPIKHSPYKHLTLKIVDIGKDNLLEKFGKWDIVILYDVLEHVNTTEEIEYALRNVYEICNKAVLISVPWIGNPCLDADETHRIKRSKEWWEYKTRASGFKLIDTPEHFPYSRQILIGEKI